MSSLKKNCQTHFQANIFNKSKCQNCFKSRELHPPNDHDLEQVKPVYAGWLCLAPEGTDFDNPVHRSRKWQRRFFILYEDGALSFALDELPSTLPQGTVDMNTCTNIVDAEPRTGQRNAVWIITSKQEIFIRGDNKDIINGWSEQLTVYLQTNTQHQKKKRKVEPLATQVLKKSNIKDINVLRTFNANHFKSNEKLSSCGEITQLHLPAAPQRRAKSLERRTSDSVITPDLLNFKKGWMVKQDENDQWKKFWFVLSTDSLRFYRDSMAEEASDLEGEIDLTKCFSVCECQVQRNYGFQIHTSKGIFTLSAMTAGIRKNWIQALMKNVLPANWFSTFSDRDPQNKGSRERGPPTVLPKPDVTQDSPVTVALVDRDPHPRPRSASEKLQEGFYRTSDWAEFRPHSEPSSPARSPCSLELMDIERRKKRQERRKRYESILGFSLGWEDVGGKIVDGGVRTLSPKSKRMMEAELEECWRKVEKMMFRPERMILLFTKSSDVMETEKLLQSYMMAVSDLQRELSLRDQQLLEMQALVAACERGFSCMEESHLKLVKELQRRHQLELQRLLLERDRLLEEESAATATAIEAIKNAHQLELQREVHRRSVSESISGDALLEETLRQHSEELASHQRELQVLSQQFTLKCLENGHLIQAVDAERKALCQCQQENQDLRTRNQELSGHLAAEITRLCSLAKQDALPLSQRMDVYEMEIMLRVKESEVQCLKQEISSLKDELQSAQKEKRSATKKYKDMYTELSIVRAKAERDADELRENLQLAHLALGHTLPISQKLHHIGN
uniref:Myosin phosphatase Rho-interacting protein-like n=1 Tax=Gouania willdenowi TaxID=441366 RepID=A0A8C5HRP6_GOUWI